MGLEHNRVGPSKLRARFASSRTQTHAMLLRAAAARITSSVLASCSYTTAAGGGGRSLEVARAAAVWWTARRIGGQPTVTPAPAARSPAWPPTPRLWAGLSTSTVRQV